MSVLELLLRLPEPDYQERTDYGAAGVVQAHEPELIEIATSPALLRADASMAESSAPVHAVRALAELGSERAVAPLLDALVVEDMDLDWMASELPAFFHAIGAPATAPLVELAGDRSRDLYARMIAVESLGAVGSVGDAERHACVEGLTHLLQRFASEEPTFNAMVIGELVDLGAREAAMLMKAAFDAECVELHHMGDWEDVQIELGMLTERLTPRSRGPGAASERLDPRPLSGWRSLDAAAAGALRRVVERPGRSWGPKSLGELDGFLFAVACAPDAVPPAEWMGALLDEGRPVLDASAHREAVAALIDLYLVLKRDVNDPPLEMPVDLFRDDLMANFEQDAPVAEWSRGFVMGHMWLEDLWHAPGELEAVLERELGWPTFVLSFFSTRKLAEAHLREDELFDSIEELAETVREDWTRSLREYMELARIVLEARTEEKAGRLQPARAAQEPGRNDPCPCGSGKKYKKCCGRLES